MKKKVGIYIHIPFCKRFCFYCHFCKLPFNKDRVRQYISSLEKEIELKASREYTVDTIYFGGGSPSLIPPGEIGSILKKSRNNFTVEEGAEVTLEANPEDIDTPRITSWNEWGINRISLGVQSFALKDLAYLQRRHTADQSLKAIELIRSSGISNISIDFIVGLPTQTEESIGDNLQMTQGLSIPHISAYLLEDVPLFEEKEQIDPRHYHLVRTGLLSMGYRHYEVSNFCLPGNRSRHNTKYWENKPYIGLGLSASGFENGRDYRNTDNIREYIRRISDNQLPVQSMNRLNTSRRKVITGLRLMEGVHEKLLDPFSAPVRELLEAKFLFHEKKRVRVNPEKILLLNEILGRIV